MSQCVAHLCVSGYILISVQHVLEAVCEPVSGSSLCSVIFRSVYSMC